MQKYKQELVGFMRTCTRMSWEQDGILKVFFFKGLTQVSGCANAELSGALNLGELHKALQGMNCMTAFC